MAVYVKNKELYEEIVKSKKLGKATPLLLDMFARMSQKLSNKFQYKNEEDRQDCIQGGLIDAWNHYQSFNEIKYTNAFSYITQVIKNGQAKTFRALHKDSQRHREVNGTPLYKISISSGNIHSL